MKIGSAIRMVRRERKVSQKQLSQLTGISVTALVRIEYENAMPRKDNLDKIAKALGIPTPYIFFFALDERDVAPEKRVTFNLVHDLIVKLLLA